MKKIIQENPITYFPLIRHLPHKNDELNNMPVIPYVFVAAVMFSLSRCAATVRNTHIFFSLY
jgi:hypothetical protein